MRCQDTTSEDWEDLACPSDLWCGEVSDSVVIYCDYEWLYKKWSINPITNPNPIIWVTHTRDNMCRYFTEYVGVVVSIVSSLGGIKFEFWPTDWLYRLRHVGVLSPSRI
jgi:hypothetical protein